MPLPKVDQPVAIQVAPRQRFDYRYHDVELSIGAAGFATLERTAADLQRVPIRRVALVRTRGFPLRPHNAGP